MARQLKDVSGASGITVDWDDTKHRTVNVGKGVIDETLLDKGQGNDFKPKRIAVHLKLDLGDPKAPSVTLDDVHVKISHAIPAGKEKQAVAGWWNGSKWVRFKTFVYANGVFDVTLPPSWPTDPPIGVGP